MSDLSMYSKAQGVLLGQVAGDSLGSLVEFQSPEAIWRKYPDGLRELAAGGTFNTLPGQPTDDSEMALSCVSAPSASLAPGSLSTLSPNGPRRMQS